MTSNQKTTTHITRRPTCAERSPVRLATDFHICICRSPTDISAARLWVGWLPKTWTQLACRPYEILSKPKRQNSFVSRLTLGQSFGTSRADFAWAVLSSLTARIFLTLGQSVGTNRADFAWTGLRPTTRRDTHNAPPDLRRPRDRPSVLQPIRKLRKISTSPNTHNFLIFFRTTMKQPLLERLLHGLSESFIVLLNLVYLDVSNCFRS